MNMLIYATDENHQYYMAILLPNDFELSKRVGIGGRKSRRNIYETIVEAFREQLEYSGIVTVTVIDGVIV